MFQFLIAIQLLLLYTKPGETVRCFECNNAPDPIGCGESTTCSDSEVCVIEQLVTTSGNVIYNTGCESESRCSAQSGRRAITKRNSDIITCRECCDGPYCNNKGCGNPEVTRPNRGVYCYDCPYLLDPATCENVTICHESEARIQRVLSGDYSAYSPNHYSVAQPLSQQQCLTRLRIDLRDVPGLPEKVYASECEATVVCNALETIQGGKCCNTDFCNDNYKDIHAANPITPMPTFAPTEAVTAAPTDPQTQPPLVTHDCDLSGGYTRLSLKNNQALCVKVYEGPGKDWPNAKVSCEREHARLVVTNTAEKINVLEAFLQNHSIHKQYWIGLWDKDNNNQFYWLTGEALSAEDWGTSPRQPTNVYNSKDEDCVYIYNGDNWHDTWCEHHVGYVCERV